MYAPRVFFSMVCVLLVFASAAYWLSGSAATVLLATVICAILLQAGYFIGILYRVRQEKELRNRGVEASAAQPASEARGRDDIPADVARN